MYYYLNNVILCYLINKLINFCICINLIIGLLYYLLIKSNNRPSILIIKIIKN